MVSCPRQSVVKYNRFDVWSQRHVHDLQVRFGWNTTCAIVSGAASKVAAANSPPTRVRSWLDWCRTVDAWL